VSDSTGNSELVLTNDTKPYLPALAKSHDVSVYLDKELELPNSDDEDNEDQLSTSIEIRIGRNLRPRCNTERKLEKLKNDRSKQSEVHTISWRESKPKNGDEEPTEDLFPKKERQNDNDKSQTKQYKLESLLSQQIATVPAPKENPFADYSRCDATSEKSENSTSIRVFLTAFQESNEDDESTKIPQKLPPFIEGKIHSGTLVKDVIGYICWKYVLEERTPPLPSENLEGYNLYLADSDGSIDWELRPIEKLEPLSKFGFSDYALVNLNHEGAGNFTGTLDVKVTLPDGTYTIINVNSRDITAKGLVDKVLARHKLRQRSGVDYNFYLEAKSTPGKPMDPLQSLHTVDDTEFFIVRENSRRCAEFEPSDHSKYLEFYAMDATTYQEYRDVFWLTKIRSKMGVVLAISQDKFDIFPHQTPSGRLWTATHSIPNEGSFEMESIVACDITDKPDDEDLWTFRIVLEHKPNSNSYKKVYFQALKDTVLEIHSKVSHLLHWHSSQSRSNYLVYKELKSRRRKTNLF